MSTGVPLLVKGRKPRRKHAEFSIASIFILIALPASVIILCGLRTDRPFLMGSTLVSRKVQQLDGGMSATEWGSFDPVTGSPRLLCSDTVGEADNTRMRELMNGRWLETVSPRNRFWGSSTYVPKGIGLSQRGYTSEQEPDAFCTDLSGKLAGIACPDPCAYSLCNEGIDASWGKQNFYVTLTIVRPVRSYQDEAGGWIRFESWDAANSIESCKNIRSVQECNRVYLTDAKKAIAGGWPPKLGAYTPTAKYRLGFKNEWQNVRAFTVQPALNPCPSPLVYTCGSKRPDDPACKAASPPPPGWEPHAECCRCSGGPLPGPCASCALCPVGQYSSCGGGDAGAAACRVCTRLPDNAVFTTAGTCGNDDCAWECPPPFTRRDEQCVLDVCVCKSCAAGKYSACGAGAGDGSCRTCTGLPPNAEFTSSGGCGQDDCPWACVAGFFKQGGACHACNRMCCPAGEYLGPCAPTSDAVCTACGGGPLTANSHYLPPAGEQSCGTACDWACDAGFCREGAECVPVTCPVGFYSPCSNPSSCDASRQACKPCTLAPSQAHAHYTSSGQGCNADNCAWECDPGYRWEGGACVQVDCSAKACAVGQYSTCCTAVTDAACAPCTNLPSMAVFTSSGSGCDKNDCAWACIPGYFQQNGQCAPCSSALCCPAGQYPGQCTATADAQCEACPGTSGATLPDNAHYPALAAGQCGGCGLWECDAGYGRIGRRCVKNVLVEGTTASARTTSAQPTTPALQAPVFPPATATAATAPTTPAPPPPPAPAATTAAATTPAPPAPPAPPSTTTAAQVEYCSLSKPSSNMCSGGKSILNSECAKWRDSRDKWDATRQMRSLAYCMSQDCEQSLMGGGSLSKNYCRFRDGLQLCYAYRAAQEGCATLVGTSTPCNDGGADWAVAPVGTAVNTAATRWTPRDDAAVAGQSTTYGCACLKNCRCTDGAARTCTCRSDADKQPVGNAAGIAPFFASPFTWGVNSNGNTVGKCACACGGYFMDPA